MGTGKRVTPTHLGEKLKIIRESLGLTAEELIDKLDCPSIPLHRASITQYEKARREPPLIVLLKYSRLIKGLNLEHLIDDEIELPKKLIRKVK